MIVFRGFVFVEIWTVRTGLLLRLAFCLNW